MKQSIKQMHADILENLNKAKGKARKIILEAVRFIDEISLVETEGKIPRSLYSHDMMDSVSDFNIRIIYALGLIEVYNQGLSILGKEDCGELKPFNEEEEEKVDPSRLPVFYLDDEEMAERILKECNGKALYGGKLPEYHEK